MHPLAWLLWLGAVMGISVQTRNPLILVLLFGISWVVLQGVRHRGMQSSRSVGLAASPLRFAVAVMALSGIVNMLTSHVGQSVLFQIPVRFPILGPLLGGPITLEALVFGVLNGLVLATLFTAFAVLMSALSTRDLIGYLPRAFYPLAVVSAIAVTFAPNVRRQFEQVREAQAIRGHRMRGLRDWLPLLMPLLVGGLERALQLAEAMTARGFARDATGSPYRGRARVALLAGMVALLAGEVLALMPAQQGLGRLMRLAAVGLIIGALWYAGRGIQRTRYRWVAWRRCDTGVLVLSLGVFVLAQARQKVLAYNPYPTLSPPPFDPVLGWIMLGLLAPLFCLQQRRTDGDTL